MKVHRTVVLLSIFIALVIMAACSKASDEQAGTGMSFMRVNEPREGAFSILVPKGWQSQGGIYRINAAQAGGPLNAIEAKCDLTFKSDAQGTVYFRILPDIVYAHEGIGGGFWGPGSSYQGAMVRRVEDAVTHLRSIFTQLHGNAVSPRILKINRLPGEINSMERGLAYTNRLLTQIGGPRMGFACDAAGGVFEYTEGGAHYREVILTGIVDMRAAQTWKNTRTLAFRAPSGEFDRLRQVMDIMRFSLRFNPNWILSEMQGQRERTNVVMKVYDEIRRIDREIVRKTSINREEIMNDNFLVLTGQEEYVNPHSNEIEMDTDAYKYRWTTSGGDVYYTNLEEEDPNIFMQRTDYKRTPIRKRRNE